MTPEQIIENMGYNGVGMSFKDGISTEQMEKKFKETLWDAFTRNNNFAPLPEPLDEVVSDTVLIKTNEHTSGELYLTLYKNITVGYTEISKEEDRIWYKFSTKKEELVN